MKYSAIICNPAARSASGKKIRLAVAFLRENGYETRIFTTERPGHAVALARESLLLNPDLIIAAGGDGTINEVINGIAGSPVPLAILPLGTTNVLAREIGVSADVRHALEKAVSGRAQNVFLGKIEALDASYCRYFCLMAGIGFDGKAVSEISARLKRVSGKAAYVASGIRNFLSYAPPKLTFVLDGKEYQGTNAVIGNAAKYGGDFRITPDSRLHDPCLYACIFRGGRRRDLLRYVLGVMRSTHTRFGDVIYLKTQKIEIYGEAHVQIDGDYLGKTPARVSLAGESIRLAF